MPASGGQYYNAFENLIGSAGRSGDVGDWAQWRDLFETTGVDFDSSAETLDAFENFLLAYYPQEGLSRDDWEYVRMEFADLYGLSEFDDNFWAAWREALGYPD